jgi:hypothetical protein
MCKYLKNKKFTYILHLVWQYLGIIINWNPYFTHIVWIFANLFLFKDNILFSSPGYDNCLNFSIYGEYHLNILQNIT